MKNGTGPRLKAARVRWNLPLREVEEKSFRLAGQWGNSAFRISASWLNQIEKHDFGMSATKLIVLAYIYGLTAEDMLRLCPGVMESPTYLDPIAGPNTTLLLKNGPLEEHARLWLPDRLVTDDPPEETTLLASHEGRMPVHYRRGIIGRKDKTLAPMIPPGSVVLIDTERRSVSARKRWTNEFERPVFFLLTNEGYFCGFCELDRKAEWLTLVPHALSYQESKRWKYPKEVGIIGVVAGAFIRRARESDGSH